MLLLPRVKAHTLDTGWVAGLAGISALVALVHAMWLVLRWQKGLNFQLFRLSDQSSTCVRSPACTAGTSTGARHEPAAVPELAFICRMFLKRGSFTEQVFPQSFIFSKLGWSIYE